VARPAPSPVPTALQPFLASTARDTQAVQLTGGKADSELAEAQRIVSCAQSQPPAACCLNMTVDAFTHPGIKRQYKPNEDSIFVAQGMRFHSPQSQRVSLFIVADGMGGHLFGLEASRLSIQTMIDWILPKIYSQYGLSKVDFRQLLVSSVQAANLAIYQQNKANGTEMGTTVTAALVVDEIVFVANVGDSRTYLYRKAEGLRKITMDHSVVAYLVENGIIKPDDIYIHPQRNQLYRSLGVEGKVHIDLFIEQLQLGDTLLLCSDGLWEMVRDPGIQHILEHESKPAQIRQALFHAALEGGGADNISIIVANMTRTAGPGNSTGIQLLVKPDTVVMPNMSPDEPQ
jgi:serine/threonine protein phosphatase PrpC